MEAEGNNAGPDEMSEQDYWAVLQHIKQKFKRKADWHRYLATAGYRYLPPLRSTTMAFVKDILRGKKKLLKQNEVHLLDVPNYPEFTVKKLYEMFAGDDQVMLYLPDPSNQSRPVHREWAYRVVCSVRSEYMSDAFSYARMQRTGKVPIQENYVQAEISSEYRALLMAQPYIRNRVSGRAFSYLNMAERVREPRPRRNAPGWMMPVQEYQEALVQNQAQVRANADPIVAEAEGRQHVEGGDHRIDEKNQKQ